ncbi:MAG TPA: hypothetical protein VIV59_02245, partial [Anaeromyxobacteraceae bacterium]
DEGMADEVKITVIATGFAAKEVTVRPVKPRQVALPVAMTRPPVTRPAAPPPLPRLAEPPAAASPAQAAARPAPAASPRPAPAAAAPRPARVRDPKGYQPLEDDQYDIPAFLRRGSRGDGRGG